MGKPRAKRVLLPRGKGVERHRYTPRNPAWRAKAQAIFLQTLKQTQQVAAACQAAKIDRTTAWAWRLKYPEFKQAWIDVYEEFTDRLEASALNWGTLGSKRTIYNRNGQVVGEETIVYPGLTQFILSRRRPDTYGDTALEHRIRELEEQLAELRNEKQKRDGDGQELHEANSPNGAD